MRGQHMNGENRGRGEVLDIAKRFQIPGWDVIRPQRIPRSPNLLSFETPGTWDLST